MPENVPVRNRTEGQHTPPPGCVLVVDDDADSQRMLCQVLEAQGHTVLLANNGHQAVAMAITRPPDVILLDIVMPRMDGYEVCRHLRLDPLLKEVALILVISADDRAARARGLEAGADDFISIPLDRIELQTRVRNLVQLNRYRKLLQERTKVQLAQAEIMSSCEATLVAWIRILERDGRAVAGQCECVAQWAMQLAQAAGLPENDIVALHWSVLLHSISSMTLPVALRSRADLEPKEAEQVRLHESWFINNLGSISALRGALEILASQHERWDGTGQPHSLAGEAISPAARVLAVVLAWEVASARKDAAPAERMTSLAAQAGVRLDPRLVALLDPIVHRKQTPEPNPKPLATGHAALSEALLPRPDSTLRGALSSAGARAQFAVAISLLTVIPLCIMTFLCLSGWFGFQVPVEKLWPMLLMVLPFMALGCWMLAKYPINVIRLRRYMERLTQGVLPDQISLVTDEEDLAAIESLMGKVVKQMNHRVRTIQSQTEMLLEAERQRVMIQSLGTACHHLGQPATVISGYLTLLRSMPLPAETQPMLEECRVAADAVADILGRLQGLTVYRSESYLSQPNPSAEAPPSSQLLTIE